MTEQRICLYCCTELPPKHEGRGRQKQFCSDTCRVKLGYRRKNGVTTNRQCLERRSPYIGALILTELEKVWLAAMLDAEGWVGLCKQQRKHGANNWYYFAMVCPITNTNKALVARAENLLNTARTRVQYRARGGNNKPIQHLFVERLYMADVLKAIRPYLIAKGRQADIVIEFCETHDELPVRTNPLERFGALHTECRALNKRGRA